MERIFTASCDRIEGGIAVIIEDENEKEYKVYPPLSYALIEGGVYECRTIDNKILSLYHLTEAEKERRKRAREALMHLVSKKK